MAGVRRADIIRGSVATARSIGPATDRINLRRTTHVCGTRLARFRFQGYARRVPLWTVLGIAPHPPPLGRALGVVVGWLEEDGGSRGGRSGGRPPRARTGAKAHASRRRGAAPTPARPHRERYRTGSKALAQVWEPGAGMCRREIRPMSPAIATYVLAPPPLRSSRERGWG